MAIGSGSSPSQKNKVVPSQTKIALVIGVAAVAIISGFMAFSRYDWTENTREPNDEIQRQSFSDLAKEMPEVKSFLQKYPNADSQVDLGSATYQPTQPYNFTVDGAFINYKHQKSSPEKGLLWESSLSVYVHKEDSGGYNIAGKIYSPKPFHGYYYTAVPQCIVSILASSSAKSIAGFPEGTYTASLSKDCSEVESFIKK
jgi:hypothetical protein